MKLLEAFLIILTAHWFGEFVLQTDWQAFNKSTNPQALARHVASYSAFMALVSLFIIPDPARWFGFLAVNLPLHVLTDYNTGRLTARLGAGFDQLIHQLTLGLTLWLALR